MDPRPSSLRLAGSRPPTASNRAVRDPRRRPSSPSLVAARRSSAASTASVASGPSARVRGVRRELPPSQVLGRGRYKPVKSKPTYVDESLFGSPTRRSAADRHASEASDFAAPWRPKTRTAPRHAVKDADRTAWLQPNNLRAARAPDPRKYLPTDPWRAPADAMEHSLPARANKKPMPSDPWRGGFIGTGAAYGPVASAPKPSISLKFDHPNA